MRKMKNTRRFKIGALTLAVLFAVMFSSSVPVYALSADAIPYGTPTIDGEMEELWDGASHKIVIDMVNDGYSEGNATGYARMMWDEKYLYVLGYIQDPTISTWENPENKWWWATDSLEVFLDERNAHVDVKNEIAQIRVSRQGILSGMLMSVGVDQDGILMEYTATKWAAKNIGNSGDYVIELAIPWTRNTLPAAGTQIGTEFQINDVRGEKPENDSSADSVVNSEVISVWNAGTYRMMTLSAEKAGSDDASDTNEGDVNTSEPTPDPTSTPTPVPTSVPDDTEPTLTPVPTNAPDDTKTDNTEESESGLTTAIAIAGGIVLLAAAGGVAVVVSKKKKK